MKKKWKKKECRPHVFRSWNKCTINEKGVLEELTGPCAGKASPPLCRHCGAHTWWTRFQTFLFQCQAFNKWTEGREEVGWMRSRWKRSIFRRSQTFDKMIEGGGSLIKSHTLYQFSSLRTCASPHTHRLPVHVPTGQWRRGRGSATWAAGDPLLSTQPRAPAKRPRNSPTRRCHRQAVWHLCVCVCVFQRYMQYMRKKCKENLGVWDEKRDERRWGRGEGKGATVKKNSVSSRPDIHPCVCLFVCTPRFCFSFEWKEFFSSGNCIALHFFLP